MKHLFIFLISILLLNFDAKAQTISAIDAKCINKRLENNDTLFVVHFWATWCGPCVKELPEFEALAKLTKELPVKITFSKS